MQFKNTASMKNPLSSFYIFSATALLNKSSFIIDPNAECESSFRRSNQSGSPTSKAEEAKEEKGTEGLFYIMKQNQLYHDRLGFEDNISKLLII